MEIPTRPQGWPECDHSHASADRVHAGSEIAQTQSSPGRPKKSEPETRKRGRSWFPGFLLKDWACIRASRQRFTESSNATCKSHIADAKGERLLPAKGDVSPRGYSNVFLPKRASVCWESACRSEDVSW